MSEVAKFFDRQADTPWGGAVAVSREPVRRFFIDNALTNSGDGGFDLHIFEIGPDVEDTFVEISVDGVVWHAVGKVFGSTAGIDIDALDPADKSERKAAG